MSITRRAAWAVPVAAAVLVGGLVAFPSLADAQPNLPALTPEELVAKVVDADPVALSGTLAVTTNIGFPDVSGLSGIMGLQSADITNLLAGTTTVKVAEDPQVGARAEIDSKDSAYVTVANKANSDLWIYSSADNQATHMVMPADASGATKPAADQTTAPTPQSIAQQFLSKLDPSTQVSVTTATRVAGCDAYTLVLTPRDAGTLIASVSIAVDAATWSPLRAQVWSTQLSGSPALDVAFTAISYSTPAASLFTFTPPAGATVKTTDPTSKTGSAEQPSGTQPSPKVVSGQGWASIVKVTGMDAGGMASMMPSGSPTPTPDSTMGPMDKHHGGNQMSTSDLMNAMTQQVPEGTLLTTYLFSVLMTPAGNVYAGAVPGSALQAAAAAGK